MDKKLKVGLIGAGGRLGTTVESIADPSVNIVARINHDNASDFAKLSNQADVLLDVSLPNASVEFLASLLKSKSHAPYVIGCTGWTDEQLKAVDNYAKQACVVLAPNFSPGVSLFLGLLERAAPHLRAWGYDAIVHETHHAKKQDSPSGTAKAIVERLSGMKPQVHASRAGNIVGTHEIRFVGPGDVLSFSHEALDRSIFARGALMAASWAHRHRAKPGLYSMQDVVFSNP